jgi:hypothetical protein
VLIPELVRLDHFDSKHCTGDGCAEYRRHCRSHPAYCGGRGSVVLGVMVLVIGEKVGKELLKEKGKSL